MKITVGWLAGDRICAAIRAAYEEARVIAENEYGDDDDRLLAEELLKLYEAIRNENELTLEFTPF